MMKKNIKKIVISSIIAIMIILSFAYSYAVTPDDIDGNGADASIDLGFIDNVTDFVRMIGTFVAVGALMIIGIKYVTGSVEERANYKRTMMPYIIRMHCTIWCIKYSSNV